MPRRRRITVPGLPMHIVQRGNNRGPCFFEDADRRFYLHHLARILPEASCELHAYCLMTNHVHLLVTPLASNSCACLMRRLNLLHSQYMNRTYERTGSLWEGRFRSCSVQSEAYLLNCYRYVELNPVRARLADSPDAFEWSSYRTNARGVPSTFITPHEEYQRLGTSAEDRYASYRSLFGGPEPMLAAIRQATNGNLVLGSRTFMDRLSASLGRRVERGKAGRPANRDKNVVRP